MSETADLAKRRPERRTQEQRRTATRLALLDATVETLVELGYARTTTTEVCARAGVSQGALFKHFPTKQELLAASAEHLYRSLLDGYVEKLARLGKGKGNGNGNGAIDIDDAIDALWDTFQRPELSVAYELVVAGRTDERLRKQLAEVAGSHATAIRSAAAQLFPTLANQAEFNAVVDTVLEALQGLAISRMIATDTLHDARVLEVLGRVAHETLQTGRRK